MTRCVAFVLFLCTLSRISDAQPLPDACQTLAGKASIVNNTDLICDGPGVLMRREEISATLATQTVLELRNLVREIQGLRAEMKTYSESLADARTKFDSTSKETVARQERWRKEALEATLDSVTALPSKLSTNEALRAALLLALRDDLPKDQAFIDAVRAALQK